jgi:hypothetical protein
MSTMRLSVYRVDGRTLEHGPVVRETVVDGEADPRSMVDSFLDREPPCQCRRCGRSEKHGTR